ncbi:hypothetical protein Tco_1201409 [Tanacetum coccineum]
MSVVACLSGGEEIRMKTEVKMEDPAITMEEYIRLKTERAFMKGKYYNWETAMYGKIRYFKDDDSLEYLKTEFPAIVYEDVPTFEAEDLPKSTVSPNHAKEIDLDFVLSFDESDDEDYTFMYDKNSFSYNLFFVNDLKSDSDNNDNKINIEISFNINTYSNAFDENIVTNRDTPNKSFTKKDFGIKVIFQIHFLEGIPLIFIFKNLYVSFGIPFDPKLLYKDGAYTKGCRGQAQVGCELCKGPHYTKDRPLKGEGKTLEEAYYT